MWAAARLPAIDAGLTSTPDFASCRRRGHAVGAADAGSGGGAEQAIGPALWQDSGGAGTGLGVNRGGLCQALARLARKAEPLSKAARITSQIEGEGVVPLR